ncbi:MAG: PfkB family carbohydrate kinase [Candidatus Methanoperedens sp.]
MITKKKIQTIKNLSQTLSVLKSYNKTVVHCHGVFDLLHIGHIRYLEQAKGMGDILVVTVTPDRYVDKGPNRPAFPEKLRAEALASLHCVDFVSINEWTTAEETLRLLRPDIYVKGSEFKNIESDPTGKIGREEKVIREIGTKLAFTEDIVFSSSNLINRFFSNFPEEVEEYLSVFRNRYSLNEVLSYLDEMAKLKVLIIGDAILDEYQYCEAIGKSSKDPILALKYKSHELFAGGVLAVANHVATFTDNVQLVTVLGGENSYEDFIRSQLNSNIIPNFFIQRNASTTIKRRFIEGYSLNKLFEIYIMDESGLSSGESEKCLGWLQNALPEYDIVIVADFGHGAINSDMIDILVKDAKFLAINTQANAGNRGFNTVSRYPRADYICIAEHEIRLETRKHTANLRPLMLGIANKMDCGKLVVTQGRQGATIFSEKDEFLSVPSFAYNVVDRVGAGDAFFSLTSLAATLNIPNELLLFIGNIAGCLSVETIGNKKPVTKAAIQKYITSLMK